MSFRGRHPSHLALAAYFDGEPVEGVEAHLAGCSRCREARAELERVRAAVRGELVAAGGPSRRPRWVIALLPVAVAVGLLLAVAAPPGGLPVTKTEDAAELSTVPPPTDLSMAAVPANGAAAVPDPPAVAHPAPAAAPAPVPPSGGSSGLARVSGGAASSPAGPGVSVASGSPGGEPAPVPAAAGSTPAGSTPAGPPPAAAGPRSASAPPALRLGVAVPTRGRLASEGDEVLRAVQAVANVANDAGGVAGRRVEVVTVPTDDETARQVALTRVDGLVGGFAMAAPAGLSWVMPGDVSAGGDVAGAEVGAERAGATLGADLVARGFAASSIGAIVGQGPDSALAAGLGGTVPVERVEAPANTTCEGEIAALRRRNVAALALAGPPEMARRCAAAAARVGWRPPGGLLLAPSAAYAHLERDSAAQGARTALGLPPPSADEPGASRYRKAVPSSSGTYRALVSFAAAELALDVARATGGVTAGAVRSAHWRSDLYDLDRGSHAAPRLVTVRFGRWTRS